MAAMGGGAFKRTPATLILRDVSVPPDDSLETLTPFMPPSVPDPDAVLVEAKGLLSHHPCLERILCESNTLPSPPTGGSVVPRDPWRGGAAARRLQPAGGVVRVEPVHPPGGAAELGLGLFDGVPRRGGSGLQHYDHPADFENRGHRPRADQPGSPSQPIRDASD